MAALFGHGNPLTTPVGQMIERATDSTQSSENWALYMEICDRINETDEGPKDAVRAMRKRLTQNMGKNHTAILYTLTCLETCVKNCGRRFHIHVANKDFLNDMVKVIGPKYDPPQAVQEKVLSMIQTWADAFRGAPELKDVEKVYQDLKAKGIEFPMTDLDSLAPIHTPARTTGADPEPITRQRGSTTNRSFSAPGLYPVPHTQPMRFIPTAHGYYQPLYVPAQSGGRPVYVRPRLIYQPTRSLSAYVIEEEDDHQFQVTELQPSVRGPGQMVPPPPVTRPIPVVPTQEQLAKLRSELDVVQGNVRVMSEMLTELTPNNVDSSDLELLQELNRTNRQMQQRIVELLDGIPNEEVTNELLRVNDDLNNVFLRYERFERYRTGQSGQPTEPEPAITESFAPPSYHESVQTSNPNVANLIDLGEDTPVSAVTSQMANVSVTSSHPPASTAPAGNDDFDMFAQSRQSFDHSRDNLGSGTAYVNEDMYREGLSGAVNTKSNPESEDDLLQRAGHKTPAKKLQDKETDYDEMESWLKSQEAQRLAAAGGGASKQEGESISSSEFDKFLSDRASAASTLPTISAQTGTQGGKQSGRSRQLQKDEDENPMFAL